MKRAKLDLLGVCFCFLIFTFARQTLLCDLALLDIMDVASHDEYPRLGTFDILTSGRRERLTHLFHPPELKGDDQGLSSTSVKYTDSWLRDLVGLLGVCEGCEDQVVDKLNAMPVAVGAPDDQDIAPTKMASRRTPGAKTHPSAGMLSASDGVSKAESLKRKHVDAFHREPAAASVKKVMKFDSNYGRRGQGTSLRVLFDLLFTKLVLHVQ